MTPDDSSSAKRGRKRSEDRKMVTEQISLIHRSDVRRGARGPKQKKEKEGRSIQCVTVNASGSGISVYAEKCLQSGSRFIIYSGKIWDTPRYGTVVWCKKIATGLYRAGILLEQTEEGALLCAEEPMDFEGPDAEKD